MGAMGTIKTLHGCVAPGHGSHLHFIASDLHFSPRNYDHDAKTEAHALTSLVLWSWGKNICILTTDQALDDQDSSPTPG